MTTDMKCLYEDAISLTRQNNGAIMVDTLPVRWIPVHYRRAHLKILPPRQTYPRVGSMAWAWKNRGPDFSGMMDVTFLVCRRSCVRGSAGAVHTQNERHAARSPLGPPLVSLGVRCACRRMTTTDQSPTARQEEHVPGEPAIFDPVPSIANTDRSLVLAHAMYKQHVPGPTRQWFCCCSVLLRGEYRIQSDTASFCRAATAAQGPGLLRRRTRDRRRAWGVSAVSTKP
jgi:hypothetical protein